MTASTAIGDGPAGAYPFGFALPGLHFIGNLRGRNRPYDGMLHPARGGLRLADHRAIAGAKISLDVQAYNFTEPRIIEAVIAAHARGVKVTVVLDKVSPHQQGEGADPVHDSGIPTFIDYEPKIAHNKVIVIDSAIVVTGSFNFTVSADTRNAENVLILRDPALAKAYDENFAVRLRASEPYNPAHAELTRETPPG